MSEPLPQADTDEGAREYEWNGPATWIDYSRAGPGCSLFLAYSLLAFVLGLAGGLLTVWR